jgi:hypothetical protein
MRLICTEPVHCAKLTGLIDGPPAGPVASVLLSSPMLVLYQILCLAGMAGSFTFVVWALS